LKKALKWAAIALGVVVALIVMTAAVLSSLGASRLGRSYAIDVAAVPIPTDSAAIARGQHLARAVTLCTGCHGDGLEGDLLFEAPGIATVYAPNLTAGEGGKGAVFDDVDWVRAIRNGVSPEGRGLMIMHSDAYNQLSAEDLGAIIAYARSVPPVDGELPAPKTTLVGRAMVALGLFDSDVVPLIPAEVIDHTAPIPTRPPPGPTAEYGEYLVGLALCRMCHGPDLRGGPPIEEGAPAGPSLAAWAEADGWTADQFVETIRTGTTPYGKALDGDHMPWEVYARMTDEELRAIRAYLVSL
jgi:cytochrome c553